MEFDKIEFGEQMHRTKAFPLRGRWQPKGLTDEVSPQFVFTGNNTVFQRIPHTSSVKNRIDF